MRTHESVVSSGQEAIRKGYPVKGVKGISPLASCLDLVDSIPIDYMHSVLEGAVRRLMNLWFESTSHTQPYYQRDYLNEIDNTLTNQHPPNEFSRMPRTIRNHLKFWKATEFRNWMLYYSLPLLLGHLPPVYWHHYALLVCAMHILLQNETNAVLINAAELMLKDFCKLLPELYGQKNCTHNIHLLMHLSKYVKLWGPLWTHSSFPYENKNGLLKRDFHGTNNVIKQLFFNVDVKMTLQLLIPQLQLSNNDVVMKYLSDEHCFPNMTYISDDIYAIGQVSAMTLTEEQQYLLNCELIQGFCRLYKQGTLYYATSHDHDGKRNNTFCKYLEGGSFHFGQIYLFVLSPRQCALIYKIIINNETLMQQAGNFERLDLYQQNDLLKNFILPVTITEQLTIVPVDNILNKAVLIDVPPKKYLSPMPNNYEYH